MSDESIDVAALRHQHPELFAQLVAAGVVPQTNPATESQSDPMGIISTNGGAAVKGSVEVANGHFIGRDLIQNINQTFTSGEDIEETQSVIAHYLHVLAIDLAGVKLNEIDTGRDQTKHTPLQLSDIYVPLDTTHTIAANTTLTQWLARDRSTAREETGGQRETRPVSALEALAAHAQLTVLGKPGSGKSTLGASVLLALAQAWQGHPEELAKLGEHWTYGPLLPIRVVLRRFADALPAGDQPARAGDLWHFIAQDLKDSGCGLSDKSKYILQRIAQKSGALILLDGLDECGDSKKQKRVKAAVDEMMGTAGPKCRFVLTARPYARPSGANADQGVYALADLGDEQIEQFIHTWYAALVKHQWCDFGEAERKRDDLMQVRRRHDLLPLARNPLLLTLMATLHSNRGRLPDDRADLYDDSVDLLLLRWNEKIGADQALLDELNVPGLKLSDLREALEKLAFEVHEQNVSQAGAADVGEDRLNRAFRPLLGGSRDKAAVVVNYIEKRAGLLVGQGEKHGERQFTFPHRTFQEFLAACYLASRSDFETECHRLARAAPSHWQVVLPLAARLAKPDRGASAADRLIGKATIADCRAQRAPAAADWTCARLAAMQLLEIGLGAINADEGRQAIKARVVDWLVASLPLHPDEGGALAVERAQAGDLLAALGDPRFDPEHFALPKDEMLGFARIAADPEFCIGTRKGDVERVAAVIGSDVSKNEINDEVTPVPEFYMGCYPVTVAQFRIFVEKSGYQISDADALGDPDNRPVRSVSWHEALAYCDWLNDKLMNSAEFAGSLVAQLVRERGWRVTLPSELEWERAARGGINDAVFSWEGAADPQRANYDESSVSNTSSVGCFPTNDFGLYDMIGNVWEWTRSLWGTDFLEPEFLYPYLADDPKREDLKASDDVMRLVRGGSWFSSPNYARCAIRNWNPPGARGSGLGFRVVLRSSPV